MVTYNSTYEAEVKQAARQLVPGGASTLAENITSADLTELVDEFGQTYMNDAYPEYYQQGISTPSWVDDVVLHVSSTSPATLYGQGLPPEGTRVICRQITTNIHETQILGTPSPYGPPPQTRQNNYRSWAS